MLEGPLQPNGALRGETLKGASILALQQSELLAVDSGRPVLCHCQLAPDPSVNYDFSSTDHSNRNRPGNSRTGSDRLRSWLRIGCRHRCFPDLGRKPPGMTQSALAKDKARSVKKHERPT
jgi:hypothetical protein